MRKYLYLIKKKKIKSWLKFWLLTRDKVNYILSEIIEGTSFNLQNTVKRYFKIFNIFGNSVQDGTPSPENPVPIHSVADDVNLFDISKITTTGAITNNGDGTITITNSYSTSTTKKLSVLAPNLKVGDTYILNLETTGTNKFIYLYGTNESWDVGTTRTIIQSDLDSYVFVYGENNQTVTISGIKIAKGTTLTPCSPYNQGTVTIKQRGTTESDDYTFQTEPLRSLPNGVRDSLEAYGIHRKIGIQTGTLSQTTTITLSDAKTNGAYMCNIKPSGTLTGKTIELEAGDYEIIYELETEIIEPYTEEQQAEYDKIKELYTFNGTTNIYSDDEVPPYLQIQYYMKGE